jgi:hypothetical protein
MKLALAAGAVVIAGAAMLGTAGHAIKPIPAVPTPTPTASAVYVSPELAKALTESEPDQAGRDWQSCLYLEGDTTLIVCPDGFTLTS